MLKTLFARQSKNTFSLDRIFSRGKSSVTFRRTVAKFHSAPKTVKFYNMRVKILPALEDNYMFLLIDELSQVAAVVDPVNPEAVLQAAKNEDVKITSVLTTHHHWDHAGGNKALLSKLPELQIFGGDERIEGLTNFVKDTDTITVGNLTIKCMSTPCHTTGHICYYVATEEGPPAVFTGDTLFTAGCGRFFEGTPEQMYHALVEKLGTLPSDTEVFCGHEYTLNNLQFAALVDPDNKDIKNKIKWAEVQRQNNIPTIPSTIGEEKIINPFMRVHNDKISLFTGKKDPIQSMKTLRDKKDNFTPGEGKKRKKVK